MSNIILPLLLAACSLAPFIAARVYLQPGGRALKHRRVLPPGPGPAYAQLVQRPDQLCLVAIAVSQAQYLYGILFDNYK